MNLNFRSLLIAFTAIIAIALPNAAAEPEKGKATTYQSPYSVKFTFPPKELTNDFQNGLRGDSREESTVPYAEWYSAKVRETNGAWGPPARRYPAPEGLGSRSLEWKRERVIAAALQFKGVGYQHHHIPDWDPPADWPWKQTRGGHNGKGLDCSNFTSFAFNFGLGIKFVSDVKAQAELREIVGPDKKNALRPERIEKPKTYKEFVGALRTGDLVFIRHRDGKDISHVVLWIGSIGQSPDKTPLVLDSHGESVKDSNGVLIPDGAQIRPFHENSWYYQSASHVLRILRAD
jgi:cell wall-associated NlpC family hydrolase